MISRVENAFKLKSKICHALTEGLVLTVRLSMIICTSYYSAICMDYMIICTRDTLHGLHAQLWAGTLPIHAL
jgi:hypothetical protein